MLREIGITLFLACVGIGAGDGFVEIKIPWQLLNFADPTKMYIHDDYYEVYGVEYLEKISQTKCKLLTPDTTNF